MIDLILTNYKYIIIFIITAFLASVFLDSALSDFSILLFLLACLPVLLVIMKFNSYHIKKMRQAALTFAIGDDISNIAGINNFTIVFDDIGRYYVVSLVLHDSDMLASIVGALENGGYLYLGVLDTVGDKNYIKVRPTYKNIVSLQLKAKKYERTVV